MGALPYDDRPTVIRGATAVRVVVTVVAMYATMAILSWPEVGLGDLRIDPRPQAYGRVLLAVLLPSALLAAFSGREGHARGEHSASVVLRAAFWLSLGMLGVALVGLANVALDPGPPVQARLVVTDAVRVDVGDPEPVCVQGLAAPDEAAAWRVLTTYCRDLPAVGNSFPLRVWPGRLGIPWLEVHRGLRSLQRPGTLAGASWGHWHLGKLGRAGRLSGASGTVTPGSPIDRQLRAWGVVVTPAEDRVR